MVIYEILNKKNGKSYIGQTLNYKNRCYGHKHKLKNNKHVNKYLQRSWNKYGEESFEFNILEKCKSLKELNKKEKKWIEKKKATNSDYGYNNMNGGNNGNHSQETKELLRDIFAEIKGITVYQYDLKGNFIRKHNSIIQAERNTPANRQGIKNCCEGIQGKSGNFQWSYTKKPSIDKYNIKRSDKGVLNPNHNSTKSVKQYDLSGNFIKEYPSISKASAETGSNKINIGLVCSGKRNTCNGYVWKYKKDNKK